MKWGVRVGRGPTPGGDSLRTQGEELQVIHRMSQPVFVFPIWTTLPLYETVYESPTNT